MVMNIILMAGQAMALSPGSESPENPSRVNCHCHCIHMLVVLDICIGIHLASKMSKDRRYCHSPPSLLHSI